MNARRRIDFIFLIAYLLVDLMPLWGSVDIIGPQWLYIGLLNLGVLNYLWDDLKQEKAAALTHALRSPVSFFYLVYCLLSAISIFFALNKIEGLVTYARTVITLIAFFNFVLLLKRSMDIFPLLSRMVAFLLLGQCLVSLIGFFADLPHIGLGYAIVNMQSGMGNKNVFAASIIIKLPFLLFNIYHSKKLWMIVHALILFVALYTLFLVNARSSFIGLLVELSMLLYLRPVLYRIALIALPLIAAIILSGLTIKQTSQGEQVMYGNVVDRLQSIDISTEQGTGNRKHIFESTLDIIRKNPLTGVGYGNWKLASIPYETFYNKDAVVNYHSHNDILETTAETGIPGGLCYLSVFISVFVLFFLRIKRSKSVFLFACLALGGYFTDACLNFPLERTTMQVYFAFWLAILVSESDYVFPFFAGSRFTIYKLFIGGSLLLTACAVFFAYQSFISMRIQADTSAYLPAGNRQYEVPDFPGIPDLTQTALPVEAVKAEYLIQQNKFTEAIQLLYKSTKANPYLGYIEYLKGSLYFKTQHADSALLYAKKAFDLKPLNAAHYQLLMQVYAAKKDSFQLLATYERYKKFRDDPGAEKIYRNALK
jgi:O-antigen ligase